MYGVPSELRGSLLGAMRTQFLNRVNGLSVLQPGITKGISGFFMFSSCAIGSRPITDEQKAWLEEWEIAVFAWAVLRRQRSTCLCVQHSLMHTDACGRRRRPFSLALLFPFCCSVSFKIIKKTSQLFPRTRWSAQMVD